MIQLFNYLIRFWIGHLNRSIVSKIREVIVLTCASLFWAVSTTPGVLSLFLESTFSEESRKIGRTTVKEGQAHEGSENQVL